MDEPAPLTAFNRPALLDRKAQLEAALQEARDEFQRLAGAIQLCDAMIAELEAAQSESEENDDRNERK